MRRGVWGAVLVVACLAPAVRRAAAQELVDRVLAVVRDKG